jgi:FkbM family methyltransferase
MKKNEFEWGWMNESSDTNIYLGDRVLDLSKYHHESMYNEIFVQKIYEKIFEVEENDIVLDIGASVGPFTYSILEKKPLHVFCFEPSYEEFKTLIKNTIGHPVTHINKGFCSTNEIKYSDRIFTKQNYMECINFQRFLEVYYSGNIDFLKIDCEGCEYELFIDENLEWIQNNIRKISGEWHLSTLEDKVKFKNFRDKFLINFENYFVYSVDGVDIKWDLFNDHFLEYYTEVLIYIDNRIKVQSSHWKG